MTDEKLVRMTEPHKKLFDEQVNVLVRMAMTAADSRPDGAKQAAYAVLMLIGATVKLAICGGYTGGPADLAKTLARMWDATKYIGKATNSAGGDA